MKKTVKSIKINKLRLALIFLVFSMLIGFAAINTKLNLNGFGLIASSDQDFRVYFSRVFLDGVGKASLLNDERNSFTFSYLDINHSDSDLTYTIKNTSNTYYADVEVSCKPRKKDGTTFTYDDIGSKSQTFRLEPGRSKTNDIGVVLPTTTNNQTLSSTAENVNLKDYIVSLSSGNGDSLNFNQENSPGVYSSTKTNSGNPVYFFHGNYTGNDVMFAEKCWKIMRTTEKGGVRLIFNGNPVGGTCLTFSAPLGIQEEDVIIKLDSRTTYPNNAYAGYMYGDLNAGNYDDAHQNIHDSVFKTKIDEWYENNLLGTNYEEYILDDVYYNDRTILEDYTNTNRDDNWDGLGYGNHLTLYASAARASAISKIFAPTYQTPNKNDAFTVKDTVNGNGALKYPVATITADEIVFSGVTPYSASSTYKSWLWSPGRDILSMSPIGFYDNTMKFTTSKGNNDGTGIYRHPHEMNEKRTYILPTITLKSDINIVSGDGTNTNPFILSSEDTYENTYTCTLNVNKIGRAKEVAHYNSLLDLDIGEEYCFEEECFYTISNDKNGTIKMIAKYNLYVGNYFNSASDKHQISSSDPLYGKQHPTALGSDISGGFPRIGGVPYSNVSTDNSYANSNVKPYVDEYVEYLKNLTGINITGQLVTRNELIALGCSESPSNCNAPNYDWVTGLTYWTMTPGNHNNNIYLVGADGFFNYSTGMSNEDQRGIRPVITVSIVEKNPEVTFVSGNGENEGDEICIGSECFYVLNYDGENYTLFSKYNLYVGNEFASNSNGAVISISDPLYGKQNALAIGDKGSPVYGATNYTGAVTAASNYATYLNGAYGLHITTSRLIKPSELATLGCDINRSKTDTSAFKNWGCEYPGYSKYAWVLNSTYWAESTSSTIYLVGGDGFYIPLNRTSAQETNSKSRGVRPVIVVPASDIKSSSFIPDDPELENCPNEWNDHGVFSEYYDQAYTKLKTMTTEEKIGQLLTMSYDNANPNDANIAVQNYHVGGVLFFANAFSGKTEEQVKSMTAGLQTKAKIPLMMSVDEEGGTVVRVSSNKNLAPEKFKSPQDLYALGGLSLISTDTKTKSNLLKSLGLNMNFAPVVDIADAGNFIYNRTLGQSPEETGNYAKTVITASKGIGVSYSLKHFPGYGNNADTHTSSSVDETSMEELWNKHLVPFVAGIDSGAEAVMISHNIVSALDKEYPSSLSKPVHDLLFNDLHFTGLAFTDDLFMDAIGSNYEKQYLKAFKAGNHVLLTSKSYATAHNELLTAFNNGEITVEELDKRVFKVLAWKYYNGVLS